MIEFENVKIFTDNIDETALKQLRELVDTGIFEGQPIRIMPDCHAGAGCVIGFTSPVKDKIIPNLVGVDIFCGMLWVPLGNIDIDLKQLDEFIHEEIPAGRKVNTNGGGNDLVARGIIAELHCKDHLQNMEWLERSLGTLGGGNHFIEVDADEDGNKYLVIHSGSRNLGKQVAEYYQNLAVKECRSTDVQKIIDELKARGREREISAVIAAEKANHPKLPKNLCYLEGQSMKDYLHDMWVCSRFARTNRAIIAIKILHWLGLNHADYILSAYTTLHNYCYKENGQTIIRKGAISAKEGERVLIPLNMRDGCIIGIGKGNPEWNYSAPHGAGRIMSRAVAKEKVNVEDFKNAMSGIYTTTADENTIDESPFAYKPSEEIISLVKETVEIEKIIKPIYNFKATE